MQCALMQTVIWGKIIFLIIPFYILNIPWCNQKITLPTVQFQPLSLVICFNAIILF